MPFTCSICSLDIGVGEELLSDEKMNLAHKRCVERLAKDPSHPSINIPGVYLVPPPPPRVIYHDPCARCGDPTGVPQRSCSRCHLDLCPKCIAAGCCGDRPAHIGEKTYCSSCGRPCKSMCPVCRAYVHSYYGIFNQNCGGQHEEKCAGARELREPDLKPSVDEKGKLNLFKEVLTDPKFASSKTRGGGRRRSDEKKKVKKKR